MEKPQRMSIRGRRRVACRCNHPVYRTEEKCYSGLAVNCCDVRASTQVVIGGRLKRFYDSVWHRATHRLGAKCLLDLSLTFA